MINPFRSEAEAFQLVVGAVAYFLAIAIAVIAGGLWPGLVVFLVATAAVLVWWLRAQRTEPPQRTEPRPHGANERRILVLANETVGGVTLQRLIQERSHDVHAEVLVVSPALNSPLRHWVSDEDKARGAAQQRLDRSLARLHDLGIDAHGEVGDSDPLQAMEDALRTFGADEIIISTHPAGRSHWLERGVVEKARERVTVPLTHVVVDLEREREVIEVSGRA